MFGTPLTLVSDNGKSSRNVLGARLAGFFGYRHICILPYNAAANGMAESCVKRIKLILDRQTDGYSRWDAQLPLAQLLLNTTKHTGHPFKRSVESRGLRPCGQSASINSRCGNGRTDHGRNEDEGMGRDKRERETGTRGDAPLPGSLV